MQLARYEPPSRNGFGMSLLAPTCPGGSCQWYNQGQDFQFFHILYIFNLYDFICDMSIREAAKLAAQRSPKLKKDARNPRSQP